MATTLKLKFARTIANLVAHLTQITIWQKDQYSSKYGFPKFIVLLIDAILRVSDAPPNMLTIKFRQLIDLEDFQSL